MNLEDDAETIRERLDALGPAPRAERLRVLLLPDYGRAGRSPTRSRGVPPVGGGG